MAPSPGPVSIRDLVLPQDGPGLRACFVELQSFERGIVPTLAAPEDAVGPYLAMMLRRCAESGGKVLVADDGGSVVGFASVWARVPPDTADEDPREHGWVSDLVVLPSHRGRGIGRRLLEEAEAFVRSCGVPFLGISVLAENRVARDLYLKMGFAEYHVKLVKRFHP